MNILNIGPSEWFSCHFVHTCPKISSFCFDPFKNDAKDIINYLSENKIEALNVFRGDLVRDLLKEINIPCIEWSTEIYPASLDFSDNKNIIPFKKFLHCLKGISPQDLIFHYDESRKCFFDQLGINVKYSQLGVNLSIFKPAHRDIDVLFFGRCSERRTNILKHLKEKKFRFVWVENGFDSMELGHFISRSKVIINVSADHIDNFEPRILLALAGGSMVVTENSCGLKTWLDKQAGDVKPYLYFVDPSNRSDLLETVNNCINNFKKFDISEMFDSNKIFFKNLWESI